MQLASRLRQRLRPEVIALVIVPTAVLLVLAFCGILGGQFATKNFWTAIVYLQFFGWRLVYWILVPVFAYLFFSAVACAVERRRCSRPAPDVAAGGDCPNSRGGGDPAGADNALRRENGTVSLGPARWSVLRLQAAKSCAWLMALSGYALAVHLISMNAVCHPPRQRVAWANELLMRADHWLFGTYVPFEMHEQAIFHALAAPMLFCYLKLSIAMVLCFVALWMFRPAYFRQYVLAFLMTTLLALPGWAAVPATTPNEAFRLNKLRVHIPLDIALETAAPIFHLNAGVADFQERVEPFQSAPSQGRFFITSLPSMHVAWGLLIVWFGAKLDRRLAILLIAWGLLNCVGAVFTLEHYAVDALGGVVVAAAAVALARGLIALEARCGLQPPPGYGIFGFVRRDVASLGRAMWPLKSARCAIPADGARPAGRRRVGPPPA